MNKHIYYKRFFLSLLTICMIGYFTYDLYAKKNGYTGVTSSSSSGCNCHGSSTSNTMVSITSSTSSFIVDPNSTTSFTLKVTNSSSSLKAAGCDIAVKTSQTGEENSGTLSNSNSDLKVVSGELTHSTPKDFTSQASEFSFTWTAPSTPGTYYLRAVGNAVNKSDSYSGDEWGTMTVQEIKVAGVTLNQPNGGQVLCAGGNYAIKWQTTGVDKIKIELSSDGGSNWGTTIADNVLTSSGTYSWDLPSGITPGENYKIRILDFSNSARNAISTQSFSIYGGVSITTNPTAQDICEGQELNLTVVATGLGATYQWKKNGNTIQNATSANYKVINPTVNDAGIYSVTVGSQCVASQVSQDAEVKVRPKSQILTQPTSKSVCKSESVQFTLTASGQDLKYQWYKNDVLIDGATLNSLSFNNVQVENEGSYYCMVSGFCKPDAKSNLVTLSVGAPAKLTKVPSSSFICEGSKILLSAEATGSDLQYIWLQNDKPLPLSNTANYGIEKAINTNTGSWKVVVFNACGSDTSSAFDLIVNVLPKISNQPQALKLPKGANAEFSISGTYITSYQWQKDGNNINGKTENKLTIQSISDADAGTYNCIVTNSCGSVTSESVALTIDKATPGARLQASPSILEYGVVIIGRDKTIDKAFEIKNIGDANLSITKIDFTGANANDFTLIDQVLPLNIDAGKSGFIKIKFLPKVAGISTANLVITSNSIAATGTITINGFGGKFDVVTNITALEFGNKLVGDSLIKSFKIINQGNYTLDKLTLKISGANSSDFSLINNEDSTSIPPTNSHDIFVMFKPLKTGNSIATLEIYFPMIDIPVKLQMNGKSEPTSIEDRTELGLIKIYPNPSSQEINFEFELKSSNSGTIDIFNFNGKLINLLKYNGNIGLNTIKWDGKDINGKNVSSGTYFLISRIGNDLLQQKIELIR